MTIFLQLALGAAMTLVMCVWNGTIIADWRNSGKPVPKLQVALFLLILNSFLVILTYSLARLMRIA